MAHKYLQAIKHHPRKYQTERSRMSIPQTPNREANLLIVGVSVSIAKASEQGAVPSFACIELRRTPPVTIGANVEIISIVGAGPTRKRRK